VPQPSSLPRSPHSSGSPASFHIHPFDTLTADPNRIVKKQPILALAAALLFTEITYRALGMDYDHDGFTYNMITHGPELSLGLIF
jgi:hypothetical protein